MADEYKQEISILPEEFRKLHCEESPAPGAILKELFSNALENSEIDPDQLMRLIEEWVMKTNPSLSRREQFKRKVGISNSLFNNETLTWRMFCAGLGIIAPELDIDVKISITTKPIVK